MKKLGFLYGQSGGFSSGFVVQSDAVSEGWIRKKHKNGNYSYPSKEDDIYIWVYVEAWETLSHIHSEVLWF